jgi:hypothetical protein
MGRSTGGTIFLVLLFTITFDGQATTNIVLCGHWEILKDLCAVWSLRNVGLIYSGSFENGEWRRIHLQNENLFFSPSPQNRTTVFVLLIELHNTRIRILKSSSSYVSPSSGLFLVFLWWGETESTWYVAHY